MHHGLIQRLPTSHFWNYFSIFNLVRICDAVWDSPIYLPCLQVWAIIAGIIIWSHDNSAIYAKLQTMRWRVARVDSGRIRPFLWFWQYFVDFINLYIHSRSLGGNKLTRACLSTNWHFDRIKRPWILDVLKRRGSRKKFVRSSDIRYRELTPTSSRSCARGVGVST